MIHITSFNEWHEDTEIEPSVVTGSTDGYFFDGIAIYAGPCVPRFRHHLPGYSAKRNCGSKTALRGDGADGKATFPATGDGSLDVSG
jgi:hypothetical protein